MGDPGAAAGSGSRVPAMYAGFGNVENGTDRREAGIREPENASEDRLKRIRQQLEELDGRTKTPREVEARRYEEIPPKVVMPAAQPLQRFSEAEIPSAEPPQDIFRAYRADLQEMLERRDQGFMGTVKAALTRITGESAIPDRRLQLLVAIFGFLVLLPPTVVCVFLYRDAVRIASQSSMGPFVTREREVEVSEADPKEQMRIRSRGRVVGQQKAGNKPASSVARADDEETTPLSGLSTLVDTEQKGVAQEQTPEIPVIERGAGKIHMATPGESPFVAEVSSGSLAGMPGNRGGAENWMSILGHMDELDVSPRTIPTLETGPAKIHFTRTESPPVIAETETKMADGMPGAIVAMSYPVVIAKADASPNLGRGMPGVAEESANAKMASSVAGGGVGAGYTPRAGSSAKQFNLLHPSVAVSAGLLSSNIVKFQMPSYPKAAKKARLEGDVLVRVLISEKGKIERAVALNGPVQLRGPVEKAVRHWRYKPYVQNGQPVQVQTWVTFHFAMKEG